ncbi:TPA: hypothetical protein U1C23_001474 [Streptococcus suis]|nr:hypothetical protein [Streptococcus suis]
MNELLEKLKNFKSDDPFTIETDDLIIKNNTIIAGNRSIQIHNISMLSKNEFNSPIRPIDYIILILLFVIGLIPPFIGMILLGAYAFLLYTRYQNHLKDKYYLVFNLGSSQNYHLFFRSNAFRDQVFDVVTKSFDDSTKTNLLVDIKNETIESQTIFESGSAQTNISGNHNNTVLGSNNTTSYNGDIISNSNIITDSENTSIKNGEAIPWSELTDGLQTIISENQQLLSKDVLAVFNQLLEATKEQNSTKFDEVTSKNKSLFDNTLIKDIISGTGAGILTSFLVNK